MWRFPILVVGSLGLWACGGTDRGTRGDLPAGAAGGAADEGADGAADEGADDGGIAGPGDTGTELECEPPEEQEMRPDTPREYAAMCEPHLGVVPTIDCGEGPHLPVYVDGVEVFEDPGPGNCDNPHAGMCTPGSSLRRHEGVDRDGNPLPHVVWVTFCRRDNQSEDAEDHVQIIGYNTETGATCFFGRGTNAEWTSVDDRGRMVGVLPGPDEPGFDTAFEVPDVKVCVGCHQSNPFIHNDWIKSAVLDDPPGEWVVPVIEGFDAPYYVVGAPEWDMRTLYIEGNGCMACHRVGMETVRLLSEDDWFPDEQMPPSSPGSMVDDWNELADCWYAGPENTPGCEWMLAPANGCDARIVGDEYENRSDWYNQGGDLETPPQLPTEDRGSRAVERPTRHDAPLPDGHPTIRDGCPG